MRRLWVRYELPVILAPRYSQHSWRQIVRQHADQVLTVDFFSVVTLWLQRLQVLFVMEAQGRRRPPTGRTASPTSASWSCQVSWRAYWTTQALRSRVPITEPAVTA